MLPAQWPPQAGQVHVSWLDQAEIYFSVVQRKVVTPNDFTDLDQIRRRLTDFEIRYNAIAQPFNWRFTRNDLHDLIDRLAAHEQAPRHALAA
jgi:hypothetical protein